jgi:hypothetical protein
MITERRGAGRSVHHRRVGDGVVGGYVGQGLAGTVAASRRGTAGMNSFSLKKRSDVE